MIRNPETKNQRGCSLKKKHVFFLLFGLLAVFVFFWMSLSRNSELKLSEREKQILWHSWSGLAELSEYSPHADSLLQFYDANKVLAKYVDEESFQVLEKPKGQTFFFVYADPMKKELLPGQAKIAAQFEKETVSLEVFDFNFHPLVQGLFFAHELKHAKDFCTGLEGLEEPLSPPWLSGELRAHTICYLILNDFTEGGWREAVLESRTTRESYALSQGKKSEAFTFGAFPEDSARVAALFQVKALTRQDYDALLTQLNIDANMMNIRHHVGDDQKAFVNGALEFLGEFYSRYYPQ